MNCNNKKKKDYFNKLIEISNKIFKKLFLFILKRINKISHNMHKLGPFSLTFSFNITYLSVDVVIYSVIVASKRLIVLLD